MFDVNDAADKINQPGTVGVIPTDTVYGIVARAADRAAVARLYRLKDRDQKPGTIIAATLEQITDLGLKRRYLTAVEQFWPGSVSIIIPCADLELNYLHLGLMSLAIRIPANATIRDLLLKTGPLLTTSANHPSQPTATTIKQARASFSQEVDFYVDGGDLSNNKPSTIIRVVDDAIEVIREGAVKIDENIEELHDDI